jgi:hypothetical protein
MNDGFAWWLLVLGIAIGVAVVWLIMLRLPRSEADLDAEELAREAGWISRTIRAYGGVAPEPLVEEVLELHHEYLKGSVAEPVVVGGLHVEDEPEDEAPEESEPAARTPQTTNAAPVTPPTTPTTKAAPLRGER